jgi:hypothetical protein
MVETMGQCDTPKESITNLLCAKQMYFPSQLIDWDYLLDKFAASDLFLWTFPRKSAMYCHVRHVNACGGSCL